MLSKTKPSLKNLRRAVLGGRRIVVTSAQHAVAATVARLAQERADEWNEWYPAGTRVAFRAHELDDRHVGRTITLASVIKGKPYVWIRGRPGGIPLSLVEPLELGRRVEVQS